MPLFTPQELETLVQAFQSGTWPRQDWHHAEHLAVAVWYLEREVEPIEGLCQGIQNYNAKQGIEQTPTSGYHESLTRFIALGLQAYLSALPADLELVARLQRVLHDFAEVQEDLWPFYSHETFMTWTARTEWVEPDLQPLENWLALCRQRAE